MKKTCSLIAVLLIISGFLGVGCHRGEQKVVKIGHIAPLTGDAAIWGEWEKEGIELAAEEINAQGGINGRQIVIIHEDDEGTPQKAVSALNKLIKQNKVKAIVGATLSSTTLACAPIAEKNKVVLLTPSAQSPKITYAGDFIFRLFPSSSIEGKYLANVARRLKVRRPAVLYINNDYGLGLKEVVIKELQKNEVFFPVVETYDPMNTNFRSYIEKVHRANADVLLLLGYPKDMALVLKQMHELGLKIKTVAPDAFEAEEIISIAGEAAEGVLYVYPILPNAEYTKKVAKKFKERYGKIMNIYNGMGYDAVKVLSYVIDNCIRNNRYTGECIKQELYNLKDFPGVTGAITFDQYGDVVERPFEVRIVSHGGFKKYEFK